MAVTVGEFSAHLGLEADEHAWERGEKLIEGIKSKIELFIGLEAVKKVGELVEGTVNAAVAVKHLAAETGTSTSAIQELGYAASLSGGDAEGMNIAFQHLARGMEEARTKGSGPLIEGIRKLHVPFSELKNKSPDQVMEILADRLSKLPDGFQKSAIAGELFGERSGARLIPLMNRGAAGIRELREEAEATGNVLGGEAIEKAEEFERSNKRLHATLTGLKNQAVIALLPSLEELVERLTKWVNANRELVSSLLEGVVKALEYVGEAAATLLEGISEVVDFLKENTDIAIALIIGLGSVIAAFAAKAALDWVVAFAPIVLATAAIAGLVLGIKKLGEWIAGHALTWRELWDRIIQGAERVVAWFAALPGRISDFFDGVRDAIVGAFEGAWNTVVQGAKNAWAKIRDIPVIGHAIKAGEFVAGGGLTSGIASPEALRQQIIEQRAAEQTVNMGDNHITINATTNASADDIGDEVARQVAEKNQEMLRKAAAAYGAGS